METLYPTRYAKRLVTIDELFAEHHVEKMHPGFAQWLRAWLIAQNGLVGIGGSWRDTGSQPDKPGFAPEGKSFHQYQRFASGRVAFCAVDLVCRNDAGLLKRIFSLNGSKANPDASTLKQLLTVSAVHRAPKWSEVPAQGSADAKRYRVHCNIASESWHMQPVIDHIAGYDGLDGWGGWITAGSPDPLAPATPTPPEVQPPPIVEEDDIMEVIQVQGDAAQYERHGFTARWAETGPEKQAHAKALGFDPAPRIVDRSYLKNLTLVGPQPQGAGVTTSHRDFGAVA